MLVGNPARGVVVGCLCRRRRRRAYNPLLKVERMVEKGSSTCYILRERKEVLVAGRGCSNMHAGHFLKLAACTAALSGRSP